MKTILILLIALTGCTNESDVDKCVKAGLRKEAPFVDDKAQAEAEFRYRFGCMRAATVTD